MRTVFVDTNVLIDFLADRQPFSNAAAKLFNYSLARKVKVYISAVSYNNIYYILRQSLSNKQTLELLTELSEMTETVDVTKAVISNAIQSGFKDFEDAIQYHCALAMKDVEVIITRNSKDFKLSKMPVMATDEFISLLESGH